MSTHYIVKRRGNEVIELFKAEGLTISEAGYRATEMEAADEAGWKYRPAPFREMTPDYAENAYDRLVFRQSGV